MRKSYVYKITNIENNKIYIGKSINPKERWKHHIIISKLKKSKNISYIHKAIKKYGKDKFIFEIIKECASEEESYNEEKKFIKLYNSTDKKIGYNLCIGGTYSKEQIEEINIKRSENLVKQNRRGKNNPLYGRKHTEEHKKNISKGNIGRIKSEKEKYNISKSKEGCKNGMFERVATKEQRKKLSILQLKRRIRKPLTKEHIEKLKNAKKNQDMSFRIPQEIKDKIIQDDLRCIYTRNQLAAMYGLKFNTIVKILRVHRNKNKNQ